MEEEPGMFCEPFFYCGMIVSGVVIEDKMKSETLGCLSINGAQKPKEFLMAMSR